MGLRQRHIQIFSSEFYRALPLRKCFIKALGTYRPNFFLIRLYYSSKTEWIFICSIECGAGRDRKTKKILARRKSFLGPLFHSSLPQSSFLMFFSSDRYRSSLGSDRDANVFHFYIDNPSVNIIQYNTQRWAYYLNF